MNVPWRAEPLTDDEQKLLAALFEAHDSVALRENASATVLQIAAAASGRYMNGIIAALATLGKTHGPIEAVHALLSAEAPSEIAKVILDRSGKVPGWGNSFVKNDPDPDFQEIAALLLPPLSERITAVTQTLHDAGKPIYPNPACYTAAVAITLGCKASIAPYLFLQARLQAWTERLNEILP
jgi:citrate synthase